MAKRRARAGIDFALAGRRLGSHLQRLEIDADQLPAPLLPLVVEIEADRDGPHLEDALHTEHVFLNQLRGDRIGRRHQ